MLGKQSCPDRKLFWVMRVTGVRFAYYKDCGAWSCLVCAREKVEEISLHLADVAEELVWSGLVAKRWAAAAGKYVQRSGVGYFRLRLKDDSLYLVAEAQQRGMGWSPEESKTEDVIEGLAEWKHTQPKRASWGGPWEEDKQTDEDRIPALISVKPGSMKALKRKLAAAHVSIDGEGAEDGDPYELAERVAMEFGEVEKFRLKLSQLRGGE